jgi:hypothetical protein
MSVANNAPMLASSSTIPNVTRSLEGSGTSTGTQSSNQRRLSRKYQRPSLLSHVKLFILRELHRQTGKGH